MTAQEKAPTEEALANHWRGVEDLMTANAYETNLPGPQTGLLTKTVIVPPLGQPLRALAEETGRRLAHVLGAEREQLLFGDGEQGAVQFWYGTKGNIAKGPQIFTVWIGPAEPNQAPRYGVSWFLPGAGGMGGPPSGTDLGGSLSGLPRGIATRFFAPWLSQFGVTTPTQFYGE